jgi:tetratricopeptide (TPR) repeat protein
VCQGILWISPLKPVAFKDDKVLELDPKNAMAYNNRGFAYRSMGDYNRAIPDFDEAIKLNPSQVSPWRNRALSRALADISEALRLAPQEARTLYIQGILRELRGEPSDAAQDFAAARAAVRNDLEWQQIERDLSHYRSRH